MRTHAGQAGGGGGGERVSEHTHTHGRERKKERMHSSEQEKGFGSSFYVFSSPWACLMQIGLSRECCLFYLRSSLWSLDLPLFCFQGLFPSLSFQFSSVAQLCPTPCDPINLSRPGLPVHHKLLGFTQTHVHRVGDAIQPSRPLSSPSPPAPNPSQHQGLFQ